MTEIFLSKNISCFWVWSTSLKRIHVFLHLLYHVLQKGRHQLLCERNTVLYSRTSDAKIYLKPWSSTTQIWNEGKLRIGAFNFDKHGTKVLCVSLLYLNKNVIDAENYLYLVFLLLKSQNLYSAEILTLQSHVNGANQRGPRIDASTFFWPITSMGFLRIVRQRSTAHQRSMIHRVASL